MAWEEFLLIVYLNDDAQRRSLLLAEALQELVTALHGIYGDWYF